MVLFSEILFLIFFFKTIFFYFKLYFDERIPFFAGIDAFQCLVEEFLKLLEALSKQVEREKLRAIASRNLLTTQRTQKQEQTQHYETLIIEKQMQLER